MAVPRRSASTDSSESWGVPLPTIVRGAQTQPRIQESVALLQTTNEYALAVSCIVDQHERRHPVCSARSVADGEGLWPEDRVVGGDGEDPLRSSHNDGAPGWLRAR